MKQFLIFCLIGSLAIAALPLKEDTAATVVLGPFLDSTDGNTAETGFTISQADVRLSKNGAAFAQKNESTSASYMENGYYSCPLDTTDTSTAGRLVVTVHESGGLAVYHEFIVLPTNVYDALVGTDALQVDAIQVVGATPIDLDDMETLMPTNFTDLSISETTGRVDVGTIIGASPIALTDIATQIETELDTAYPAVPTEGSLYSLVKAWAEGERLEAALSDVDMADWLDGGRLDLILDGIAADTDTIITDVDAVTTDVSIVDGKADDIITDISEVDITAEVSIAELLNAVGVTEGGTWTFGTAIKVMTAWAAGDWRVKPNFPDVQQLIDPDDGETVILEMEISTTTPYRTINVLID